jgi:hypothetical protein
VLLQPGTAARRFTDVSPAAPRTRVGLPYRQLLHRYVYEAARTDLGNAYDVAPLSEMRCGGKQQLTVARG